MPAWSMDVESARRGGSARARLMLRSLHQDAEVLMFVDADTDEVFRLDVGSSLLVTQTLGLAYDGARILLSKRAPESPETDLMCHELATGARRSFGRLFELSAAAFSPTSDEVAVCASDTDGSVMLAVLDVGAGAWRTLAASASLTSWSSTITWSPDGKHIAVDYFSMDDVESVAVIDVASGALVQTHAGVCLINHSNGVWLDASRLILVGDDGAIDTSPYSVLDISEGSLTPFGDRRHDGLLQAVVGDALVWSIKGPNGLTVLEASRIDGSERRQIATVSPEFVLERMEIAPAVWRMP